MWILKSDNLNLGHSLYTLHCIFQDSTYIFHTTSAHFHLNVDIALSSRTSIVKQPVSFSWKDAIHFCKFKGS